MPMRLYAASGSSEARRCRRGGPGGGNRGGDGRPGRPYAGADRGSASVRYDLPTLIRAIRAVTGEHPLVGETSAGHFGAVASPNPRPGVAVLAMTAGPYRFGIACSGEAVRRRGGGGDRAGSIGPSRARAGPFALRDNTDIRRWSCCRAAGARRRPPPCDRGRRAGDRAAARADDRHLSETFVFTTTDPAATPQSPCGSARTGRYR